MYYDKVKEFILKHPKVFDERIFSLSNIDFNLFNSDEIEPEIYKYIHSAMVCLDGKSYIEMENDNIILIVIIINVKNVKCKLFKEMKKK